jgi:hypothetical protein
MKWTHASNRGMTINAAMVAPGGRIWLPPHSRARARAFSAEDLDMARIYRKRGEKLAARMRLQAARQDRIFITRDAPPLFG